MDLKQAVLEGRSAIEAQHDWGFDRKAWGNASEIAGCLRQQWYDRNVPTNDRGELGYARRGSHAEAYVTESLRAAGVPLVYYGDNQVSLQSERLKLSATPDGMIHLGGNRYRGLEIKSFDPRTNTARLPKERHVIQLQIAMELSEEHHGWDIEDGILLYINASNFDEILTFEVKRGSKVVARMSRRAKQMLAAQDVAIFDREGQKTGDCKYCPHTGICGVMLPSGKPEAASGSASFADTVRRYAEAKAQADALEEEAKAMRVEIISELERAGKTADIVGNHVVSIKQVAGRTTYDTKAAIASGVDLAPFAKTGAPSVRLEVKLNA